MIIVCVQATVAWTSRCRRCGGTTSAPTSPTSWWRYLIPVFSLNSSFQDGSRSLINLFTLDPFQSVIPSVTFFFYLIKFRIVLLFLCTTQTFRHNFFLLYIISLKYFFLCDHKVCKILTFFLMRLNHQLFMQHGV